MKRFGDRRNADEDEAEAEDDDDTEAEADAGASPQDGPPPRTARHPWQ